jgi:transposase
MNQHRDPYPSDLRDAEWEFVAPYLTLMREDAPQRRHSLRAVFNALRYVVRTGCPWRYLPHEFPPYFTVFQQAQRGLKAGVFEAMAHDLRAIPRLAEEREANPTATIFDSRTVQSTPESGVRAGDDGAKKRKGSKVRIAVDTLGHLLALKVTPADEQDRAQVEDLARAVQAVTGSSVELAFVDPGDPGSDAQEQAAGAGMRLEVVKLPEAKRGFVLLPRRWVVERSFAWFARFRRLARDYERLAETVKGWHWLAFISIAVKRIFTESA